MKAIEEVLLKFVFVNYASLADVAKRAENISEDKYLYNLHLAQVGTYYVYFSVPRKQHSQWMKINQISGRDRLAGAQLGDFEGGAQEGWDNT